MTTTQGPPRAVKGQKPLEIVHTHTPSEIVKRRHDARAKRRRRKRIILAIRLVVALVCVLLSVAAIVRPDLLAISLGALSLPFEGA